MGETGVDIDYVAMLDDIYLEVIGSRCTNRNMPFLDVGGNSINVVKIIKKIETVTGITIPTVNLFEDETSSFSEIIEYLIANQQGE